MRIRQEEAPTLGEGDGGMERRTRGPCLIGPRPLPGAHTSQAELRLLAPPGGSIWVARTTGAYCGHFPPFRRRSASWRLYGTERAAKRVLRYLWRAYCLLNGYDESVIPIIGLMAEDVEAAPPGAGASASNGG